MSKVSQLEDAIEKVSVDQEYFEQVVSDPEKLTQDFGLSLTTFGGFKRHGDFNHKIKEIRPIALCCTCVAPS